MKRFILLCFAFSVITACSKKDIDKWTKRSCDVAEQNDVYSNGKDEISRRNFKKTYNANGLAKTLVASTSYAEGGFDSLVCSIDYQKNAATIHVTSIKEPFQGGNIEINSYNLAVTFDPVTGNATSVGSDVIAYENKKVQTFGDVTFSYDVQGNLISIYKNQGNPAAQLGERYTYDLNSKAGKQELYLPSTLAVGVYVVSVNVGIAEMMMWLPTQSPYRRIKREFGSPDYFMTHDDYSNHTYSNGKLVAFSHGAPTTIRNSWKCN